MRNLDVIDIVVFITFTIAFISLIFGLEYALSVQLDQ